MTESLRPVARGAGVALAVIVPVSAATAALEAAIDELDGSRWMLLPFAAVIAAYAAGGAVAGRGAPGFAMRAGAAAALAGFAGWLVVRSLAGLVLDDDLGFGTRAVLVNAALAIGFGALGASFAERDSHAEVLELPPHADQA